MANHVPLRSLLLLSLIQKRFLKTSASPSSFKVQYLIDSCGLPSQLALSTYQKFQHDKKNLPNAYSVLQYLKDHDFSNTHISKLIDKYPRVLQVRVGSNLKPKFDFLTENGFVGQLLPQLILSNPSVLRRALDSQIKPCFELLNSLLGCKENLVVALKRASWLLTVNLKVVIQPNVDLLIKEGLPLDRVAKLILWQPRAVLQKMDRMVYALHALKSMGLDVEDNIFIHALRVRIQLPETTWKKKIEGMKSLQWSEEEILGAFKRYPPILALSEKKIRSSMDFFINTMELERQNIIACPLFLGYSIDKRVRPRYNVIKVLKSKKLISRDKKMTTLLTINEKNFLTNYVHRYVDVVPGLLELYMGNGKTKKKDS